MYCRGHLSKGDLSDPYYRLFSSLDEKGDWLE